MASTPATPAPATDRAALRQQLLVARRAWASGPDAIDAQQKLKQRVFSVLLQLEPECLGIFWPMQGEFNPRDVALSAQQQWNCRLALPYARRDPVDMHFRLWDGQDPTVKDECGIASAQGAPVVPDVVLVPCVGFSPEGWRLGYGGGYFDRFLAAHPEVTAIGVSWEIGQLQTSVINPQTHDRPLMAVLTESNIWSA
jgi:5,10-methenyltetrahydrofolate synthetase